MSREIVFVALTVFTATLPNATEDADSAVGFTPVAESVAVSGLFGALVVTVRVLAGAGPSAVGVTVIMMAQVVCAANAPERQGDEGLIV